MGAFIARLIRTLVALVMVGAGLAATGLVGLQPAAASTDFTSFSLPLTGAGDYATDFPSSGFGPAGILNDGQNFFAWNEGDQKLYKFAEAGGSATAPLASANEPFNYGIGLVNGVYYGSSGTSIVPFDPVTLTAGAPLNFNLPCPTFSIVGDPLSTDIFLSGFCGIWRVQNPTGASPTVTQLSPTQDFYDGLTITNDGQHIWGAEFGAGNVVELSRTGAVENTISLGSGIPDGIAVAKPNAVVGTTNVSNNVFVNDDDGTVMRIDTNNGNVMSTVASGGTRGDLATVGPDGCFYVTQSDRVEKLAPCFFQQTVDNTKVTTSLTGGGSSGAQISVNAGTTVTDTATITGPSAASAGGTVTYTVYSDSQCQTQVASGGTKPVSAGTAAASNPVTLTTPGTYYWQATYSGDGHNTPSSGTCGDEVETVLQAKAAGAFVVGDVSAGALTPGTKVDFWGAQWAKDNKLSGGAAPASFKGFTDNPATPACGVNWSTTPGNSASPPATLPNQIVVVVTSKATKTGSTIAGDTVHLVLVNVGSGYGPDPGHPGIGTVASTIC